jgi:hypothetical protein
LLNLKDVSADSYWVVVVLAVYYAIAWLLVGRKRAGGPIAVRYTPPEDLSPAAVRYIYTMACDGRSYAAIVAQLAARKLLAIVPDRDRGAIHVEKLTEDDRALRGLPEEERRVFENLLEFNQRTRLKPPELRDVERIQTSLEKRLSGAYFTRHLPWVACGLLLTAAATIWLALTSKLMGAGDLDAWMPAGFTGFTVAMYGLWGYWTWEGNRLAFTLALRGIYRRRTLPLLLAFVLVYPALWYLLMRTLAPAFAGITTLLILLNGFAAPCLRNYTAQGRRVRDEIEGFRQFLAGTEQDRLERMNVPGAKAPIDPEMIPYAIALDLREAWGDALGIRAMVETQL